MNQRLHPTAFGAACAVLSGVIMLLLGIAARMGFYTGAARMMMQWHMFFDLTAVGILTGMIEAVVVAVVFGWAFAYCYNHCLGMIGR